MTRDGWNPEPSPWIAPLIGYDPRPRHLEVDRSMRVAMNPQSHPISSHQILPVIREDRIQDRAGVWAFLQGAQRRGVVGDNHGRPGMGLGDLAAQPVAGLLSLFNQVRRPDAAIVIRTGLAKITQCLLSA